MFRIGSYHYGSGIDNFGYGKCNTIRRTVDYEQTITAGPGIAPMTKQYLPSGEKTASIT